MTSRAAEEGDVVKNGGSSSSSSSSSGSGRGQARTETGTRTGTRTGARCLQLLLWVWVAVLTVGLAIDLSLRYIPGALPTNGQPMASLTGKPKPSGTFLDLVPSVRPELVRLMIKGKDAQDYQTITEDGLYLLGGEVTLLSPSLDKITVTIRKRSDVGEEWDTILVGRITKGSLSTGFMGRILLLEAGSHISMNSTNNNKLETVDVKLSSLAIYKLGNNPAP